MEGHGEPRGPGGGAVGAQPAGDFPEGGRAALAAWQWRLADLIDDQPLPGTGECTSVAPSFEAFAMERLGWQKGDLLPASALEPPIAVPLDDYDETLAPTGVVPDPEGAPQLLVQELPAGTDPQAQNETKVQRQRSPSISV